MKLLVINGPNLNLLGLREPDIYGRQNYAGLCSPDRGTPARGRESRSSASSPTTRARSLTKFRRPTARIDGIVINPAAYTHTSVAILDALKAVALPAVEVHISDVDSREPFRQVSYAGMACLKTYKGLGFDGYVQAIRFLKSRV